MSTGRSAARIVPCGTCPYRRSTPLGVWYASEYERLQREDGEQFGSVFGCHAYDGTICRGWLADQKRRGVPCITLRLRLTRRGQDADTFAGVDENDPDLYCSIAEMVRANEARAFPGRNRKARALKRRLAALDQRTAGAPFDWRQSCPCCGAPPLADIPCERCKLPPGRTK